MATIFDDYLDVQDTSNHYELIVAFYRVEDVLRKYVIYVLIVINLIGNAINIGIFTSEPFRKVSMGFLLCCLSIADILNSFTLIYYNIISAYWMNQNEWALQPEIQVPNMLARVLMFLYKSVPFVSPSILSYIAIDRFVSVFYPAKIARLKSKKLQLFIMLSVIGLLCLSNMAIFFQELILQHNSDLNFYYVDYTLHVYPYMNLAFASTIPFLIMCVSNVAVVIRMKRLKLKVSATAETDRENKFLVTSISLNLLFFIFYLPRYVIEFYRTSNYGNSQMGAYAEENFYLFILFDKATILSDYWTYLYSTLQFIAYTVTNTIYREQLWTKFVYPFRKYLIAACVSIIVGTGIGFLIFYLATRGKIRADGFCIDSSQCEVNMKCDYAKCVCEYNTLFYNNNTCKIPTNSSSSRNFIQMFDSSQPEIEIHELPESVISRDIQKLTTFDVVSIDGVKYNAVFETAKASILLFDGLWRFQNKIKFKINLAYFRPSITVFAVDVLFIFVDNSIYKYAINATMLKARRNITDSFRYGFYNKVIERLYLYSQSGNSLHIYDRDLNRIGIIRLPPFVAYTGLRGASVDTKGRLYLNGNMFIYVYENLVLVKKIATANYWFLTVLVDDVGNIVVNYEFEKTQLRLLNKNGGWTRKVLNIKKYASSPDYIRCIGFDVRNKLVAITTKEIHVFD